MTSPEKVIEDLGLFLKEGEIAREIWQREIVYFENLYVATKNPLYVWQIMSLYCRYAGRFPLPDWCQDYYSAAANDLFSLSRRQDIRETVRIDWESLKPLPPISAETALALVPLAIGLSGHQGKSMLSDFNSRLTKGYEVSLYENLRENGVSRREATNILLRITKREDERNLRRSFAKSETRIGGGRSKATGGQVSSGTEPPP